MGKYYRNIFVGVRNIAKVFGIEFSFQIHSQLGKKFNNKRSSPH